MYFSNDWQQSCILPVLSNSTSTSNNKIKNITQIPTINIKTKVITKKLVSVYDMINISVTNILADEHYLWH